ncbi:2S albumin [Cajanus cajan]|uniref:2S albumin n=1 Tax=Cajanus cajan TaxID=3821 RepID=A0A151QQ22_CAJCA|nr:2S albumin [Cajanus cajan]XP_020208376.1 2S albumin [Cajanus cajan]KYP32399.1 2S albumin [Cajanus cajan]KYP32402.1 2S albumin [Cajanus cajan]
MTKLTVLIVFAVLFVAHTCSAASKQQEQESCSEQLESVNLRPCAKHVMEKIQRDDDDDDDDVLAMRGRVNYIRKGKRQVLEKCCEEMSELQSAKCQCRALQKIMEEQSQNLDKTQEEEMEKELMYLAMRCGFGPMLGCDLRSHHN